MCSCLGAVYKGRPANGEGGWFVKIRTSEKLKFQILSEIMSYICIQDTLSSRGALGLPSASREQRYLAYKSYIISIYFDFKIEHFYREKPLHLNAVVQPPTNTTYY